jgi:hypothetical protein
LGFIAACGDDDDDGDSDPEATVFEAEDQDLSAAAGDSPAEVHGDEYSFDFDEANISTDTSGLIFSNVGELVHELVVMTIPADADVDALFTDMPADFAEVEANLAAAGATRLADTAAEAGDQSALAFQEPLEPGRYVLACFIYEDDQYHAEQGMWAEFAVE